MPEDRYFGPDPKQKAVARELYDRVVGLPLICPYAHMDPWLFADPDYSFGTPTEMLIIPDRYVFRILYSQGVLLEKLGIPRRGGADGENFTRSLRNGPTAKAEKHDASAYGGCGSRNPSRNDES